MVRGIALLLMVALLLPACNTLNKNNQPPAPTAELDPLSMDGSVPIQPGLPMAVGQRFKDIPLPVGLKEDLERSFVYESSSIQIGRMVYNSKDSINDLAQFFIRECPGMGWQMQNVLEAGGKLLVFNKAGKRLEILVQGSSATLPLAGMRRVSITLTPSADVGAGL
jgi:hypothetical protein